MLSKSTEEVVSVESASKFNELDDMVNLAKHQFLYCEDSFPQGMKSNGHVTHTDTEEVFRSFWFSWTVFAVWCLKVWVMGLVLEVSQGTVSSE